MARDLRLFYLFRLLSTSYLFVPIAWPFMIKRGLAPMEIWSLSSIYSIVVILTEVPTGMISDRIGRRRTMIAGALCTVAACTTFYFAHGFASFAVAQALAALSMTLCSGADSAYLFDLLHDHGRGDEYPRREGTASAWHQAGSALAFALGGLLADGVDLAAPYLAAALVASVAFFVALFMRRDRPQAQPLALAPRECLDHMRQSVQTVWRKKTLMWAVLYSSVVFVLLRSTEYAYQPYLQESGFSYTQMGLVFAGVYLVAAFVAQHTDWLRRRFAEGTLLWLLLATLVVTFVVLGQIAGTVALGVLLVQAVANGLYSPLVKPLLQRDIHDSQRRATVLSVESMIRRGAFGLFSLAIGWCMTQYSTAAAFTLCGGFGLVALLALAATKRPASRARPAPPVSAPMQVPAPVPVPERDLT